jgi:hypothetical protein
MQPIGQSIPSLTQAIQQGESVGITDEGTWYYKGLLTRIINVVRRVFFGYDETLENAQNLAAFLATPKRVCSDTIKGLYQNDTWTPQDIAPLVAAVKASIQERTASEEAEIQTLVHQREQLESLHDEKQQTAIVELNRKIFSPERWSHRHVAACLDRGVLSQKYLGMDQHEIEQTPALREDVDWLTQELLQWQSHQFPAVDYLNGPNDEQVRAKIEYTCRYRECIAAARQNRGFLELCFQSVFKSMPDNLTNAVDIFIQAPRIQEELRRTYLDKRIREVANNGIRFEQQSGESPIGKPLKDVKLLMNGEFQSIIDPSSMVRVAADVVTSVSRVFDEFEAQNHRFISMEYLQDAGVTKFDGRVLDLDLDKEEWWKDLPVIRRMTREQVESTYGIPFHDGYALFVIRGSRTTPDLSADGNHGWSNIIYPLDDGTFNVIAPGKFSDWFPVGLWQAFYHIFRTHKAYVTLVDANEFMSSRDRISIPLPPLSKEKFFELMGDLRNDLLKSRRGELVFQAQGDNCASWIQSLISRHWPALHIDPYQTRIEDVGLPGAIMPIVWAKSLFPNDEGWQEFRRWFCSLCGAIEGFQSPDGQGGTKTVRLIDHKGWHDGVLQLPSRLWVERERVLSQVRQASPATAVAT